jgi:histidinol dehydrogenase
MIQLIKNADISSNLPFLKRKVLESEVLEKNVAEILNQVKIKGNEALINYTALFDKVELTSLSVSDTEFENAEKEISVSLKDALQKAYSNILKFHLTQQQKELPIEIQQGVTCWRKSVPIQKVGLYVPGGTAPLFSTVLMLGIPANIAGCSEIILCTPCNKGGKIHPAVLYAAKLCNIKKVFKIGGAQAIAAMTYGTQSIPKVYKIFGPGNQYVTCAKQLVQKDGVAIDMPAGPSEVAILADDFSNASFVAADMLSQAEHGADSMSVLVTNSETLAHNVQNEIEKQILLLPRKETALKALENSCIILVSNLNEGINLLNEYAPEHLILSVKNPHFYAEKVLNAGSVFLGNYSPESAGDYASGTNHTLPTNAFAKAYSGVSLDSFMKKITFQEITKSGLQELGNTIIEMAQAEGLQAHANAVKIRM